MGDDCGLNYAVDSVVDNIPLNQLFFNIQIQIKFPQSLIFTDGQLDRKGSHRINKIYPIPLIFEIRVCLFSGVMKRYKLNNFNE